MKRDFIEKNTNILDMDLIEVKSLPHVEIKRDKIANKVGLWTIRKN